MLVELNGSECKNCGYKQNFAALEFHHRNVKEKLFQLDLRSLSNRSWERIEAEAQKCDLVCFNGHKEIHNPEFTIPRSKVK